MKNNLNRRGAIIPLFAIVLPVMIILSLMAMNLSYMQLTESELKIATDAAARAGCRSWSKFQDVEVARQAAAQAAEMNTVAGRPLLLNSNDNDTHITFGSSNRNSDGGRYEFDPVDDATAASGDVVVSGVEVSVVKPTNLLMEVAGLDSFSPTASSIASQIDRDIALAVDRSVSMTYYDGDEPFRAVFNALQSSGAITAAEADDAKSYRGYSENVLQHLTGQVLEYAISRNETRGTGAPVHSRWETLEIATEAFFEALDGTDPLEQVSICSFASTARVDLGLTENLPQAEDTITALVPNGSTAIGDGLLSGLTALNGGAARPNAVPIIIVFTDGVLNGGIAPELAVQQVIADNNNTIVHTVTFTGRPDQAQMRAIAHATGGEHFHANTRAELIEVFRRIATSVPTLLTN